MSIFCFRSLVLVGIVGFACFSSTASAAQPVQSKRPNFVVILLDDLGWTDFGCMGSTFYETPNIDRLAAQGMTFSQAYAAANVCSPTRASLLTGKYPARLHITDFIPGRPRPHAKLSMPTWTKHLPLEEWTLAEALREAGYATASIGKWHLGGAEFFPDKQGFDRAIAGTELGAPPSYFSPYRISTLPEGEPGEYLTDRESLEAVRFIEANKHRPFFLYLPHHAVHTPIQARKELIEKYRRKATPGAPHSHATYAAMIESVDQSVGRVLAKLDELHLAERTVVVVTSDNGGLLAMTKNTPLRAGKGSAYEGGVRVPLLIRAPGIVSPRTACDVPVITCDLYPTILALAGVPQKPKQIVDGESLEPLLRQTGALRRQALFWHYPHYHGQGATPYGAIRSGDWRLIEFYDDGRLELYNLSAEIGETTNLAGARPDLAASLRRKLDHWRREVGAQMPSPNPNYDAKQDAKWDPYGKGKTYSDTAVPEDTTGWVLQFEDEFADESYRKRWRLEGCADLACASDGSARFLRIQTRENPLNREQKQSVLWFGEPIRGTAVRFVFRARGESRNQSLFLFNANPTRESGRRSIFDWSRPDALYVRYAGSERIEMYSVGMLRDREKQATIRYLGGSAVKTRSFPEGVHIPVLRAFDSPCFGKPDTWFEFDLRVEGRRITLLVDGKPILETADSGSSVELGTKWAPLTDGGFFGLRNFVPGRVDVDYVRVFTKTNPLRTPASSKSSP